MKVTPISSIDNSRVYMHRRPQESFSDILDIEIRKSFVKKAFVR
jgi:hypothetical protein